jgi:predicted permease
MLRDFKYGARTLMRSRSFLIITVLASAVAVGANIAIFSVVNAVLLRPLGGVRKPSSLTLITRELRGNAPDNFSYPDYLDLRDRTRTLAGIAASCPTPLSLGDGGPVRLRAELVSGNYFSVLGVEAEAGRLIEPGDDMPGRSEPVAVLSSDLWQRQFGRERSVVGRSIVINGHSFTVAGVADRRFRGLSSIQATEVWVAVASQPLAIPRFLQGVLQDRNAKWLGLFGRLGPGVAIGRAHAEIRTLGQQQDAEHPEANEGTLSVVTGVGLDPEGRASLQGFLVGLQAACALLLIIACNNVAGLFLIRARSRVKEVAIRQAVGADRGSLLRQFLIEGLLLAFTAAGLGLLMTPWLTRFILLISPPSYNLIEANASIDVTVLGLALLLSIGMGSLFGLVSAMASPREGLAETLKDTATSAGRRRAGGQDLLVVFQVALSLVLVVGAGLIVGSMQKIRSLDKGFDDKDLMLSSIDLTIQGYSERKGRAFYESLLTRLRSIPGVESASLAKTVPPYDWSDRVSVFHQGEEPTRDEFIANWEMGLRVDADHVATAFFKTMGISLVAGRDFTEEDRPETGQVAIISHRLAERLWPGESAVGKHLVVPSESQTKWGPIEIIGIARDVKYRSLTADPGYLIYLPEAQSYDGRATLVVRSANPQALLPAIRSEVASLDPDLPLYRSITMSGQVADSLWRQRMAEAMLVAAALAALALVAIGLYSIVAHYAAQRTREFGIRIALGATASDVVRVMLRRAAVLGSAGLCVGLGTVPLLMKFVSGTLYQVAGYDPEILLLSVSLLASVVLAAGYIPARRAGQTDPMEVMRYE